METLIIDRKKWGNGNDGGTLRDIFTHKQCCLGFFCLQKGITKAAITGRGMPLDLIVIDKSTPERHTTAKKLSLLLNKKGTNHNRYTRHLARINDSTNPQFIQNPALREERIAQVFRKLGVLVKFIN